MEGNLEPYICIEEKKSLKVNEINIQLKKLGKGWKNKPMASRNRSWKHRQIGRMNKAKGEVFVNTNMIDKTLARGKR